jgi:hypothetical protein
VSLPRKVKPNPKDPDWVYPYASRQRIENLTKYFMAFGKKPRDWHTQTGKQTHVFDKNRWRREAIIPFESVPPWLRHRAEQWFNRKIAECKAEGRPNWPSPGKIRSLRMNACHVGRNLWTRKNFASFVLYRKNKKAWLLWLEWNAKNERRESQEPMPHRVLEVA